MAVIDPRRRAWRQSVLKRDKFRCMKCGSRDKRLLNAHHIKTWSKAPALRYYIPNGISLCQKCHRIMNGNEAAYERLCNQLLADASVMARISTKLNDMKNEEES